MVYGIILLYYEKYADKSIKEFDDLLKKIDPNSKLIAISNSDSILASSCHLISGDNQNWEFSGWDVGLSSIDKLNDSDVVIFCNDTFCHHNPWDDKIKKKFTRVFSRLINENSRAPFLGIAGTTDCAWKEFSIDDKKFCNWISSYLFLMTGSLLKKMNGSICIDENRLDKYIHKDESDQIIWNPSISQELQRHLTQWIFGQDKDSGWYNKNNISPEKKIRKIKTILNEKYLTAICNYYHGKVIEVKLAKRIKLFLWSSMSLLLKRIRHDK
ncbi:hypothetical protein DET57_11377 [Klebsiella oxytoca]|uniref:Glycosyltransferase n=1 Tax=Klebsiella oxytoca TaxID=571 RepID=A0A318FLJ8_KLEOX|nr:hypothetical protein [Klebsiella oxytoca]PXW42882.1 hypothetical protein DET57_11377 [Klebsiella oxytoca]HCB1497649.1 hypothetical protein [Klebsiella michiganensis]HCB1844860.1 hypothetical protein [Klebsiella oxytoca]